LFGGGTAPAGTAGGGGLFGNSQAAKPATGGLFGAQPAQSTGATGGLFGAQSAQNTGAAGGLFGAQPAGATAASAGAAVLPREPTVANIDRVVPGVLEKFKKIEEKMREEEKVMNELQAATRKMRESFSGFSSSLSTHQSRVSWALHHVLVLKREAQNLAPVVQRDKQLALQVEQLHQQLEQNVTAANASLARACSAGGSRDAVYVVPLQVPCPLSTPLYQQLLQEVWSVSGKLQQLEQQVKLLRLERETAARSSCSYTVDGVSLAGGYSESGVDFHSEVQMIKEVLESQREVLLATAQKALELRENTRRMQDYLERRGVKIPVFPEDQEEVAVNAMAVQATQTTGRLFGSTGPTSSPLGGIFGPLSSQTTPAAGGLFGTVAGASATPATGTGGGLFGGSAATPAGASATAGTGLFGSAQATSGGLFGAASGGAAGAAGTSRPGGGLFGGGPTTATGAGGRSLFGAAQQKSA
ncbi:nucleoporin FG repeat region protein, partial [Toxoplasma gondii TgCatPRC2]